MNRITPSFATFLILTSSIFCLGAERDPHRPICASEDCKKVKKFLKTHYCGESPFGNGPEDGCDIRLPKKAQTITQTVADYSCEWNDEKQSSICKQIGQLPKPLADALRNELQRLGLNITNGVNFRVLASNAAGLTVAKAAYFSSKGTSLWTCEVLVVFTEPSKLHVLREVRFQETDADVPTVTTWSPIDISDVNGDGRYEIILEGDAYEDHWLEVLSVADDLSTKTIFSGLGYYL
jgi:hypothetical protein